jgi:hypothetical protein
MFYSEHQGRPKPLFVAENELTREIILGKVSRIGRGVVPQWATRLTACIDVGKSVLHYGVLATDDAFNGSLIEYGAYPEQQRAYFTKGDAHPTLMSTAPGAALEGAIYSGLTNLSAILARAWLKDTGGELRVERCLVDANWDQSTDTVYSFCRQSPHAAVLLPSHGAGNVSAWTPRPGERVGPGWLLKAASPTRGRHVTIDTNYWKSFSAERLRAVMGDRASWTIYGDANEHTLLVDHWTAEKGSRAELRGRVFERWDLSPGRENDFWDVLVGATVAASIGGATLGSGPKTKKAASLGDLWNKARRAS